MAGGGRDEQLKLLGAWPSPFLHRVRVALHLKGLEYEYVEEDIFNKSELLLASNPVHKKVPVLLHAGRPVPESMLIVEYLDDALPGAGQAILPADPHGRAVARFWAAYVDDKLHPAIIASLKATTEEEMAAATANTFAALEALEGAFAELSGGKGFFGGDTPGYADVALGGFIAWLRLGQVVRRDAPGRQPDPAPRRVGAALRRARRRQGSPPGRGPDRGVRQGTAGTVGSSRQLT